MSVHPIRAAPSSHTPGVELGYHSRAADCFVAALREFAIESLCFCDVLMMHQCSTLSDTIY